MTILKKRNASFLIPKIVSKPRQEKSALLRQEAKWGYLFLLPTGLGFLVFVLGPLIASFGISLLSWNLLSPPKFAGISNYVTLFKDIRLQLIFRNTFQYVIADVLLKIGISMGLALILNRKLGRLMRYLARTAIFFPVLVSVSSIATIWVFFLQKDVGVLNYYLHFIGIPKISWLSSAGWSLRSIIFVDAWKEIGFYTMMFLAGLYNIPSSYYEAAQIDGANDFQLFRYVTLPLWTPSIFFGVVIALIDGFQVFSLPYLMTKGGPGDTSRTVIMYIYETAFRYFQMGYASAIAVIMFVIISVLTLIQFRGSRGWVFYR